LHAISEAYRSVLPSGTFPVTILFVTVPFEDVDVNVHPAKTEVRFKHQGFIHDAIRDSVLSGLTADKTIVAMGAVSTVESPFHPPEPPPRVPDSWMDENPILKTPFALQPPPADLEGQERPLGLTYTASAIPAGSYSDFDRVKLEVRPLG